MSDKIYRSGRGFWSIVIVLFMNKNHRKQEAVVSNGSINASGIMAFAKIGTEKLLVRRNCLNI